MDIKNPGPVKAHNFLKLKEVWNFEKSNMILLLCFSIYYVVVKFDD